MNGKILMIVMALAIGISLISCVDKPAPKDEVKPEELLSKVWDLMAQKDTAAVNMLMAEEFQAVHEDGAINKAAELQLISGLNMSSYEIQDLKVTRNEATIITTYMVSVEETIEGERLSKKPAARLSVFVKKGQDWLWMAHANLKPLEEPICDSTATAGEDK